MCSLRIESGRYVSVVVLFREPHFTLISAKLKFYQIVYLTTVFGKTLITNFLLEQIVNVK